jgi:hypothetical protein
LSPTAASLQREREREIFSLLISFTCRLSSTRGASKMAPGHVFGDVKLSISEDVDNCLHHSPYPRTVTDRIKWIFEYDSSKAEVFYQKNWVFGLYPSSWY